MSRIRCRYCADRNGVHAEKPFTASDHGKAANYAANRHPGKSPVRVDTELARFDGNTARSVSMADPAALIGGRFGREALFGTRHPGRAVCQSGSRLLA